MHRIPPGHPTDVPIRSPVATSRSVSAIWKLREFGLEPVLKTQHSCSAHQNSRIMRKGENRVPKPIVEFLILVTRIGCKIQGEKLQSFLFHLTFAIVIS